MTKANPDLKGPSHMESCYKQVEITPCSVIHIKGTMAALTPPECGRKVKECSLIDI